jgi:hypothetical protein
VLLCEELKKAEGSHPAYGAVSQIDRAKIGVSVEAALALHRKFNLRCSDPTCRFRERQARGKFSAQDDQEFLNGEERLQPHRL